MTHSSPTNMTYNPPPLPDYLSRNHSLSVIVGVPTDEQVEAIHDVIRAVNSMSAVPALYDRKLSTKLAQHLFAVQLGKFVYDEHFYILNNGPAVYRNEYPSNIFPVENTYTPPSIPSHIPIALEPIVGAPSDGDLESAHGAVRTLENLANSPFFDSALSAKLSQHLFNLQFARYIQDSNQGHFNQERSNPSAPARANEDRRSNVATNPSTNMADHQASQDTAPGEPGSGIPVTSQVTPPNPVQVEHTSSPRPNDGLSQLYTAQQETNRLLNANEERLKVIGQTLHSIHFSANRTGIVGGYRAYYTINDKGELPSMHHLDDVYGNSHCTLNRNITTTELVAYLKFYSIGTELIDEETGTLKPDKEADAKKLLAYFLYYGSPPASGSV
ncbi:unnamed protein product [Rhizoctonia solani]|uniref:Uncharacterized protein n=1 Tax=Rhizoctonia solani TaxID=456999 RepID=A0A8H3E9Q4_9AGAM|nr:unnamed protein product [Rhizoctonia solani]